MSETEQVAGHDPRKLDWDDLRVFLAVTRHQTVRGAANALRLSVSTVSRRIESLETALSSKVFERTPKGLRLSCVGEVLLKRVDQMDSQVQGIHREVVGQDMALEGPIRLSLPTPIAQDLLMDDLAEFGRQHPKIGLSIDASYDLADLDRREADIVIRFSAKPGETLVGRRLLDFGQAAFATPDYIAAHSFSGAAPTARWLSWGEPEERPPWVRDSRIAPCRLMWSLRDPYLQRAAAEAGIGMAVLPCFLGDKSPKLRRVSQDIIASQPAWVLTHADLRTTRRVRVLADFLYDAILKKREIVTGAAVPVGEQGGSRG